MCVQTSSFSSYIGVSVFGCRTFQDLFDSIFDPPIIKVSR